MTPRKKHPQEWLDILRPLIVEDKDPARLRHSLGDSLGFLYILGGHRSSWVRSLVDKAFERVAYLYGK
jgi:hypothetical protein